MGRKHVELAFVRLALAREEAADELGISPDRFDAYVRPHLKCVEFGDVVVWPARELQRVFENPQWLLTSRRRLASHLRQAVLERDGYVCGLCGGEVEPYDVHIDHVFPVSLGGGDDLDNLQVAHAVCNMRKGNGVPVRDCR